MKAFLMAPNRDFDYDAELPANLESLIKDLELDPLLGAMGADDPFLAEVAKRALLLSCTDPETITYRQTVLKDCLENPEITRELYQLAAEALRAEKSVFASRFRDSPSTMLSRSLQVMKLLKDFLARLAEIAERDSADFRSDGFRQLFTTLRDELSPDYLAIVDAQLDELEFKGGVLISARLGPGNTGIDHVLRRPPKRGLLERLTSFDRSSRSFTIADRDENGYRALGELQDKGFNQVANALSQATEHVLSFFVTLRVEVGFYVACLNLHERLAAKSDPTCFPIPRDGDERALAAAALYDPSLALMLHEPVVRNDLGADGKQLVVITGANQGGKSTFLRSVGVGQLMMQAGMFVAGESFAASVCAGVFTHFKREEDESMKSGKLDEELARMSEIADRISPGCMLLSNESFASTNEREGSEIARQVVTAMVDAGVRVLVVTHQYDFAHGVFTSDAHNALFLRAQRAEHGKRRFKLGEGEPLPTSYGEDSYERVFGERLERTGLAVTSGRA